MRNSILALLVAIGLAIPVLGITGDNVPDLKGTWKGQSYGIKYGKGDVKAHRPDAPGKLTVMDITLKIDSQEGRIFSGMKISAKGQEKILGVIRADNKSIGMTDEDSYHLGEILAPDKMEIVWMEAQPPVQGISHTIYTREK